jgi:hypothetical protein
MAGRFILGTLPETTSVARRNAGMSKPACSISQIWPSTVWLVVETQV